MNYTISIINSFTIFAKLQSKIDFKGKLFMGWCYYKLTKHLDLFLFIHALSKLKIHLPKYLGNNRDIQQNSMLVTFPSFG